MSLFRKKYKPSEIIDDIANTVEAKISEKDGQLTSEQKDEMYSLHEQKFELTFENISEDEPYYRWYTNEIKLIKENHKYKYFRTMALSGTIAYFAHLYELTTEKEQYAIPPQLAKLPKLQLLYEVYRRLLERKGLEPLAH